MIREEKKGRRKGRKGGREKEGRKRGGRQGRRKGDEKAGAASRGVSFASLKNHRRWGSGQIYKGNTVATQMKEQRRRGCRG